MRNLRDYAALAAIVVEQGFPPVDQQDVLRTVTALNLLNAIIKQPDGRRLTSYHYIKGMVACLFVWLLYHPQEGVEIDWDSEEDITYICVGGTQYSFHYVPLVRHYVRLTNRQGLTPQTWDGEQRQLIAAELLCSALDRQMPVMEEEETEELLVMMCRYNLRQVINRINALDGVEPIVRELPPEQVASRQQMDTLREKRQQGIQQIKQLHTFVERHLPHPHSSRAKYGGWKQQAAPWKDNPKYRPLYDLTIALKFSGWWEEEMELSRDSDSHCYQVVRYTGNNYRHLVSSLVNGRPLYYIRPERLMRKGWHYFIQRTNWQWTHMTYTRYLLMKAHYNYVTIEGKSHNLCITYGLARYLACAYPKLRFINVLNFTRFKVHRKVYSNQDLKRVPLYSKARQLKVWMVADPLLLLGNLDVESLPKQLIADYVAAPDYNDFFRIVHRNGRVGLLAYSRYHLLPPIYRQIQLYGHYAHVMNEEGKWADYSLLLEEFETDFIFDKIYYDPYLYVVIGCLGNDQVILHDMFNPH